ncbi:MAG TPA: type II toxin-antitoxin system RelE/ParE family toxin [Bryobacteraceae bacterium]|jgi:plasmid stabilization system protein ParE|nr:type II toxin-antitoxin system RelE/ParE family toxin [Bryobacteraceae bacterium]
MSGYILSVPAQEDLAGILGYYFEEAGYRISRKMAAEFVAAFRKIAKNPGIGHQREDLVESRAVLFWLIRDFLILYRTSGASVEIVMIARGSRDIARLVQQREL